MDKEDIAKEARDKIIASILEYTEVGDRSVIFAFVDEEGESGTLITANKEKFIPSFGDPRHAGFLKKLSNLLTLVFCAQRVGAIN